MKGGRLGQNFLLHHAAVCTVCECGREGGYVMGLVIVFFCAVARHVAGCPCAGEPGAEACHLTGWLCCGCAAVPERGVAMVNGSRQCTLGWVEPVLDL